MRTSLAVTAGGGTRSRVESTGRPRTSRSRPSSGGWPSRMAGVERAPQAVELPPEQTRVPRRSPCARRGAVHKQRRLPGSRNTRTGGKAGVERGAGVQGRHSGRRRGVAVLQRVVPALPKMMWWRWGILCGKQPLKSITSLFGATWEGPELTPIPGGNR